jgi:hypothetical protein
VPQSDLAAWRQIEEAAGQCRQPVRLRGWQREHDPATGEVIGVTSSSDQPGGYIEVPCGNGGLVSARLRSHKSAITRSARLICRMPAAG